MRYVLLLILLALAVVLVLHVGRSGKTNPLEEASAALDRTKAAILPSQLQQVEAALDAYANQHGTGPGDLAELVPDYLRNDALLIDPWGMPLRLEKSGEGRMVLVCAGPDHTFTTRDDIRRSLQ